MPDRRFVYRLELDARQAQQQARAFQQQMQQQLSRIQAPPMGRGAAGGMMGGGIGPNLAGGFGAIAGYGIAGYGAAQVFGFARTLDAQATAYRRVNVAALELAGSQSQLNSLMQAYERATGGAIDRATALQQVTQLQAIGFADTSQELEKFVRAARGASIATGQSMDYIVGQLQLSIANMSTMRLDQLGLGVTEVKQRIDELKEANSSLTEEMAYQEAILGLLDEKYGNLATSAEGAATGQERLTKAVTDARLAFGELVSTPLDFFFGALANWVNQAISDLGILRTIVVDLGQAFGVLPRDWESSWNPRDPRAGRGVRGGSGQPLRDELFPAPTPMIVVGGKEMALSQWDMRGAETARMVERRREELALAEKAAREAERQAKRQTSIWEQAVDRIERAHRDAASTFLSKLEKIPGLFGTSPTTPEQAAMAEYGMGQNFVDDYLRRLRDEVLNEVDWEGVDVRDAARRIGMDPNADPRAILARFEQAWADSSLFANPQNLELLNQAAIQAGLERQRMAEMGRSNILEMAGLGEDSQGVFFTGLGDTIASGMIDGAGDGLERFANYAIQDMVNSLRSDMALVQYADAGGAAFDAMYDGFTERASSSGFVNVIVAAVMSEINAGLEE